MQPCITKKITPTNGSLKAGFSLVEDYRAVWLNILPGLRALLAQETEADWTIEGVEEMLRDGEGFLLIDDDDPTAFAIMCTSAYRDGLALLVFAMWHQSGDAVRRFIPHIEFMARASGFNYLRFYSQRIGMTRFAPRFGFHVRSIEYLKELQP